MTDNHKFKKGDILVQITDPDLELAVTNGCDEDGKVEVCYTNPKTGSIEFRKLPPEVLRYKKEGDGDYMN